MRKSLKEQVESKCKHFNGLINETCEAGVRYDSLPFKGMDKPCFKDSPNAGKCDKCEWKTAEEVQARLNEMNSHVEKFKKSLSIIKEIKEEHKGKDWKGVKECPECGENLHVRHAAFNGHVWGKCETENCLSWME